MDLNQDYQENIVKTSGMIEEIDEATGYFDVEIFSRLKRTAELI